MLVVSTPSFVPELGMRRRSWSGRGGTPLLLVQSTRSADESRGKCEVVNASRSSLPAVRIKSVLYTQNLVSQFVAITGSR